VDTVSGSMASDASMNVGGGGGGAAGMPAPQGDRRCGISEQLVGAE